MCLIQTQLEKPLLFREKVDQSISKAKNQKSDFGINGLGIKAMWRSFKNQSLFIESIKTKKNLPMLIKNSTQACDWEAIKI